MPTTYCPLCSSDASAVFQKDKKRDYLRCPCCQLVFVPVHQHLEPAAEKAIYDLHQNHADDPGYRQFLSRLSTPLSARLGPQSLGLDYGCGPGPLLGQMLEQQGHSVNLYDPYYASHPQNLQQSYDFITCTEVVEHFRQPQREFQRLFALLKPNGCLGIMTKLVIDAEAFGKWHYKNDPTHVSFFSKATMQWLAQVHHCRVEFIGKDVMIFQAQA